VLFPILRNFSRSFIFRLAGPADLLPFPLDARTIEEGGPSTSNGSRNTWAVEQEEMAAILELRPVERFVYVISVLERYSDQDCSVLLECARRDVVAARIRAFQQLETMSPEERQRALDSPEYRNNYSEQERGLLRGMSTIGITPNRSGPPG